TSSTTRPPAPLRESADELRRRRAAQPAPRPRTHLVRGLRHPRPPAPSACGRLPSMTGTVFISGLLVVVGLFGIVVPVLPGTLLVALGIFVWASELGTAESWSTFGVAAAFLLVGAIVKYVVPGRRLKAAVPLSTLVVGGVGAVAGFF